MSQLHSSQGAPLDRAFIDYLLTTVESTSPLRVVKSTIPGAGMGVVVPNPVPESCEIFKVKEPLVTQIENHKMDELCDQCFNPCKRSKVGLASDSDCVSSAASGGTLSNAQSDTTANDATNISFNSASSSTPKSGTSSPPHPCDECNKCERIHFCSLTCQEAASNKLQKQCFQKFVDEQGMHNAALMAMRLSIRHLRSESADEKLSIDTLACHPEEQGGGDTDDQLRLLLSLGWDNLEHLRLMYFKVKTNALPISLPGSHEVCGFTLDAFSALINHSCDPNCYFILEHGKLCFRALRDIPAGSELLVSYLHAPGVDVAHRRPELLARYRFLCQCPRCLGEYFKPSRLSQFLSIPSGQRIHKTLHHFIEQAKTTPPTQEFLSHFTTVVNTITNSLQQENDPTTSPSQQLPHPLSTAWQLIAHGHNTLGDHETALKIMLNQCFVVLPQLHQGTVGPAWVASLNLLSEAAFGAAHKFACTHAPNPTTTNQSQPQSQPQPPQNQIHQQNHLNTISWWQRKLVTNIYRAYLLQESDKWCGPDARFVRRYKHVLETSKTGIEVGRRVGMVKAGTPGFYDMFVWGQRVLFEEMGLGLGLGGVNGGPAGVLGVVVRGGELVLG